MGQPPVEPVLTRAGGVAVVSGTQHPAAAVLFCDWLLDEGQDVVAAVGRDPTRRDLTLAKGIEQRAVDVVELADSQQAWLRRYEDLLSLGRQHR